MDTHSLYYGDNLNILHRCVKDIGPEQLPLGEE